MERVLSVSQLNEYVRRTLAADPMLKSIRLRGEISNFKRHSAGHLYFSLKDEESRIACVMFRSSAASLRIQPRDGMRVVISGSTSLYTQTGQYQFYVDSMRDDGVGELYIEFEQLKAQLQAEGLFDAGLKKPLPLLPAGVGIITSATGAVIHDIQQVAARRNPGIQLTLRPALVQGDGAAADIVRALRQMDARKDVDVIILGRGGGSLEELWPFNEEAVARAIFACEKPVVSAVGHETDFTIADFVADVRAATPSVAAELVVPRLSDLRELLDGYRWRMGRAQAQRITLLGHRLDGVLAKLYGQRPGRRIIEQRARIDALAGLLTARTEAILRQQRLRVSAAGALLPGRTQAALQRKRMRLDALPKHLAALAPQRVLDRGYALATDAQGRLLTRAGGLLPGEAIHVRLRSGAVDASITEVYDGTEEGTQAEL